MSLSESACCFEKLGSRIRHCHLLNNATIVLNTGRVVGIGASYYSLARFHGLDTLMEVDFSIRTADNLEEVDTDSTIISINFNAS